MNVQEATTRRLPDLKERHLPENCRETINTILKETYGYEQFRNLEIYDDLSKGKEKLCISQGQLIENVILEAEKAWKSETQVDNIVDCPYRLRKILVVPASCHLFGEGV